MIRPHYAGPIVDSRKEIYKAWHAYHRLRELPNPSPEQAVSSSAEKRIRNEVNGYAPPGLLHYLDDLHVPVTKVDEEPPSQAGR